ncbi:Hypothetical predicted protein [Podarcis lilfordi]|uniref:Uncharacterized protein n=1 Tax=Podarcis lilfordi TaxID=74358 RepID=A0AA35K7H6_9SAUR|nr:Hypothetical predicted protein [Podarcis lilfordi]
MLICKGLFSVIDFETEYYLLNFVLGELLLEACLASLISSLQKFPIYSVFHYFSATWSNYMKPGYISTSKISGISTNQVPSIHLYQHFPLITKLVKWVNSFITFPRNSPLK